MESNYIKQLKAKYRQAIKFKQQGKYIDAELFFREIIEICDEIIQKQ